MQSQDAPAQNEIKNKKNQLELQQQYTYYSNTGLTKIKYNQQSKDVPVEQVQQDKQSDIELDDQQLETLYSDRKSKSIQKAVKAKPVKTYDRKSAEFKHKKKYELGIVYKKTNGKMGVRKIKLVKNNDDSIESRADLREQMIKKYQKLHIDSPSFDKQAFEKFGSFFNKKFWEINILWGSAETLEKNTEAINIFLHRMNNSQ